MARDQVEEVKSKIDIVDVIGERIDLKKAGKNFKSPCPFHSEKLPSFIVSPELQIYKCFGCGEGGDVFKFLKEYEGMDFGEALRYLAEKVGVKLEFKKGQSSDRARLIEINELVSKFYNYLLLKHPKGRGALNYLIKKRGLDIKTIRAFGLGYSPKRSDTFSKFLIGKKKLKVDDLEKLGLIFRGGGSVVDRFYGRIIFPLFDHRGNTVGFSGRLLPENDTGKTGKYINTPETQLYHKSDMLYGLNETRKDIKRQNEVILVEGELDMISLWQFGIKNAVATKGTAITKEQALLLKRFADVVILSLDSDLAGNAAARRGIEIAEKAGLEVKVVKLTKYKDPDEAVRKDKAGFEKLLRNPISVWDFLVDSVFDRHKGDSGAEKQKISKEIIPVLASISDSIVQAHYVSLVAKRLSVPESAVINQIRRKEIPKEVSQKRAETVSLEEKPRRILLEERFIALSFSKDPKVLLEEGNEELIKSKLLTKIVDSYKEYKKAPFDVSDFAKSLPPELFDGFSTALLTEDERNSDEKEIELVKKELKILNIKGKLGIFAKEITKLEREKKQRELKAAQENFAILTSKLAELTKED